MNIVIVIDSLVGGGAEKVMLTLAEQIATLKHNVTILSLANSVEYHIPSNLQVESLFTDRASKVDRFWLRKASVAKLESWFEKRKVKSGTLT